jgi:ATP-dependent DNA helicase RecG
VRLLARSRGGEARRPAARSPPASGCVQPDSYTRTGLAAPSTAIRRQAGFGGSDPPPSWPPPHGRGRPERLSLPLDTLTGVGPTVAKRLAKLGLRTVGDLLLHRPRRYEAAADEVEIASLAPGDDEVAIAGVVRRTSSRRVRRLSILEALVADGSGPVRAVWFNQPWLAESLQPGTRVRLRGRLKRGTFNVRSYDIGETEQTADFAPVYPASEDVSVKKLRELAHEAVGRHARDLADPLPAELKQRRHLPQRADALAALHFPVDEAEAERARRRLAFDELLVLQLGLLRRRRDEEQAEAPGLGAPGELVARYRDVLPFALTEHQERAIAEIDADLARTAPMQRLLQGDVGSGKTVVALYALLRAVESGRQGALMAPTETLAEQHFLTVESYCRELGVPCALLSGSVRGEVPNVGVVVGTHALIQQGVDLSNLAVAVVDEQHRFGVEQRQALAEGRTAHVLHMTATPIPRTLALTVYGDLQVSEIARPPANRRPIVTAWVTAERSSEAYRRLRRHLDDGRQAYVVCPLIEESETSQARAAEAEAGRLQRGELADYRVGLLHGRLRPGERRELMTRFNARELDVLVATTVIEVGVDVPNATIMIVQEADRFGLAQLHQLRGRVGRGAEQSYCLLVSRPREELTDVAVERLEALVATTDGFELAEKDLELRGAGQLLGKRQAGISDLRFTLLRRDRALLEQARAAAAELVDYAGPLDDAVAAVFAGADVAA